MLRLHKPAVAASWLLALAILFGVCSIRLARAAVLPAVPEKVAILRDSIEGLDLALADQLTSRLNASGFAVTPISCEDLASPEAFSARKFDRLILTDSPRFPLKANDNFLNFLKDGGDVVLLGGHPLTTPLEKYADGLWRSAGLSLYKGRYLSAAETRKAAAADTPTEKILFDFERGRFRQWERSTNHKDQPTRLVRDGGSVGKSMRIDIKGLDGWDVHTADVAGRIPTDHNLICLWAKGDAKTPQLSVEVHENDGSRWIKVVNLTPAWQRFALDVRDFYYLDGGPKGERGAYGDHLRMDKVQALAFGLASGITEYAPGDHTFWIDEVGTALVDYPPNLDDSEKAAPNVIGDYEPVPLDGIASLEPASDQTFMGGQTFWTETVPLPNALSGSEVIGFTVADRSRFIPILTAKGKDGRDQGCLAGLTVNYGGPYKFSNWLVFGLKSPQFYRAPAFPKMLAQILQKTRGEELAMEADRENSRQEAGRAKYPPFNYLLATQSIGPSYQLFTDRTRLVESAEAIRDLGSNTIKLNIGRGALEGYRLPPNPKIRTLREMAEHEPSFRRVLDMPFSNYVFWAMPLTTSENCWLKGLSRVDREKEYREMYDLSCYLLKTYSGTGRMFLLGHWEGDWCLLGSSDPAQTPTPQAIKGMTDWLNVRQQAVDDAKRDTPHKAVGVYSYTEINLIRKAMAGGTTLINDVVPKTNVDLVSFSSYDGLEQEKGLDGIGDKLKRALDYIESKLPPKKTDFPGRRVIVGEYGFPLKYTKTPEAQDANMRAVAAAALEWGAPFILFWEMYDNDALEGGINPTGFWMINNKGKKQPVYITHYRFLERARDYVDAYRREHEGKSPSSEEYRKVAVEWLRAR